VPALSSSLIAAALEQLRNLPAGNRTLLVGECPSLLECPQQVPDPRNPRGVRHTLTSLLLAAVSAVLAGGDGAVCDRARTGASAQPRLTPVTASDQPVTVAAHTPAVLHAEGGVTVYPWRRADPADRRGLPAPDSAGVRMVAWLGRGRPWFEMAVGLGGRGGMFGDRWAFRGGQPSRSWMSAPPSHCS